MNNLTLATQEAHLRALCWGLRLTERQTAHVLRMLPTWGYDWCCAFATDYASHNAGGESAGREALRSHYAFVEPPMEPLGWRDWRFIGSVCGLLLAGASLALWWALDRLLHCA